MVKGCHLRKPCFGPLQFAWLAPGCFHGILSGQLLPRWSIWKRSRTVPGVGGFGIVSPMFGAIRPLPETPNVVAGVGSQFEGVVLWVTRSCGMFFWSPCYIESGNRECESQRRSPTPWSSGVPNLNFSRPNMGMGHNLEPDQSTRSNEISRWINRSVSWCHDRHMA